MKSHINDHLMICNGNCIILKVGTRYEKLNGMYPIIN